MANILNALTRWLIKGGSHEIQVGPSASIDGYSASSLQAALTYAGTQATAANPWTVRLLPGNYDLGANVSLVSNVALRGSGKFSTIITIASSGILIDGSSTANLSISDLTILNSAPLTTDVALKLANATGCRLEHMRIVTTGGASGITKQDSSLASGDTGDLYMRGVDIEGTGFDNIRTGNTNLHAWNCKFIHKSLADGSDNVALQVGASKFYGCEFQEINALTNATGSKCLRILASTALNTVHLVGCYLLQDISAGNLNGSAITHGTIDIANGVSAGHDYDLYIDGSIIEYKSPAITSAAYFGGLFLGRPTTNGTKGRCRIVGSQIRDLGGSGATVRADVGLSSTDAGGVKVMQAFTQAGSRFNWANVMTGTPALTYANYGVTENTQNLQAGVDTFATAATKAVTLPVAFTDAAIVDYKVLLDAPIGETFWVTAKSNTGFTLNSSNAASTATVRYVVMR